ncbi:MAG: hypothetical protein WCD12_06885 [Candidatus Binatus sp.]|uniref:hypothetical protein n=1 Tax=Candidatus Binatus sp. TaxID=2811406 RepID=UPI003C77E916
MRRSLCLMLAVLLGALAVSQSTRLSTLTLSSAPTVAIPIQKLARTFEEVGSRPIDLSISSFMTVSLVVVESKPKSTAANKSNEADVTEWPSKCHFHRRMLPPSPDDGN